MLTFILCIAALVVGYIFYGKRVDKIFGSDDRETPAIALNDGVDFVPMKGWKIFLVQLLNIAGLGPIFGALNGALFGPVVYLWIVFGTIFAGGVHDYMCGMLSMRHKGASISEITGTYLGKVMLQVMRVFSVILLVMVGVVFSKGPAGLLALLTPEKLELRGPQEEVDAVSYAKVSLNIEDAVETVDQALPYVLYNEAGEPISGGDIHAVQDEIRVVLPVDVVKELPLEIDFQEYPGLSESNVSYRIEPESIMVSGEASILNGVDRLVLDSFDLSQLGGSEVYHYVIQLPEGCSNLSGVTRATLTISFIDLTQDSRTATDFQAQNVPDGKSVTILTDELTVRIRGTAADVASVRDDDITVLADLREISGASGTYTVPAEILINTGADVGGVGTYQVTVNLSGSTEEDPTP